MTSTTRARRIDSGFTLPELLISVVITATIVSVLALTIATSMRAAPQVTNRADSAVAVQGITTWLPPDVDSAEPGQFDIDPDTASGCAGGDPAGSTNIVRLQWTETFNTISTTYVANYRYVIDGSTGEIIRVSCSGKFSLGSPNTMKMSAKLSTTLPVVTPKDFDGDGKDDQIQIEIVTLPGEKVIIEAATKNPNETLPPVGPTTTSTTTTTTTTTTTSTSTTSTTAPNAAPTANAMHILVNAGSPITFDLDAQDPEGGALTGDVTNVPAGWDVSVSGLTVTLTAYGADGLATLTFEVTDPLGASSGPANLDVEITTIPTTPTTTTTSTTTTSTTTTSTTTTSTTTTTTIPPCAVSTMTVSPNPVQLQNNGTSKLKKDVTVTISGLSGYCVGLYLKYDTGAPNNQWIRGFPTSAPYTLELEGHPHGTELWVTGPHVLEVRDGYDRLLKQVTLTVTN